ncbi:MAG TPA: type II toxin-antitoxin system RelE/ParE family toxin [Candidatus Binatia bacterium]|jgi:plasmid stabilization system protein ParE|nr:type II toxin-antitoxin system RelE/ParE family toxin [Candidatus Binatia bacterium]
MNVSISGRAEADLVQIYAYLAVHRGVDAAERFRKSAGMALDQLGKHPALGPHPGWATRHTDLHFWVITRSSYLIFYESCGAEVSIERVLDGRRDVRRIIESRLEEPPPEETEPE